MSADEIKKRLGTFIQPWNPRWISSGSGRSFLSILRLAFLVFAVGALVGAATNCFRWLFTHATTLFFAPFHASNISVESVSAVLKHPYVFLIPAVGGLLVGLFTHFFAKDAEGHGVSEIMAAQELKRHKVRPLMSAETVVASSITIGSGGSAGPEGPAIQIGSSLGSALGQLFRVSRDDLNTLLACGAAAGLAALYNSPLGGTFFAIEVLLQEIRPQRFALIVLSAITSTVVARHVLATAPFVTANFNQVGWESILFDLILGLLAAPVGVGFLYLMNKISDYAHSMKKMPSWLKPALGGLLVGLIGMFAPRILGTGEETIRVFVLGSFPLYLLLILVAAKLVATSLTLGSGGSGGVFTPSIFMGAALGGAYGLVIYHLVGAGIGSPAVFALIGMATVIASSVRAPLTGILLVAELTGDFRLLPGLIAAVAGSILLARLITPESIYTLSLTVRGIKRSSSAPNPFADVRAGQAMDPSWPAITDGMALKELETKKEDFHSYDHPVLPVVDGQGRLDGLFYFSRLDDYPEGKTTVAELMEPIYAVATADEKLHYVLRQPGAGEPGIIPVIDSEKNNRYLGMIDTGSLIPKFYCLPKHLHPGHQSAPAKV